MPNSYEEENAKALLSSALNPPPCHILVCCHMSSSLVRMLYPSPSYLTTFPSPPQSKSIFASCCPFSIVLLRKEPCAHIIYGSHHMAWALSTAWLKLTNNTKLTAGQWKSFSISGFSISHSIHNYWDLSISRNLCAVCIVGHESHKGKGLPNSGHTHECLFAAVFLLLLLFVRGGRNQEERFTLPANG